MDRVAYLDMMDDDYDIIREINKTKGHDYAGDDDALRNFKEAARDLGVSPALIWAVYANKHWSAIMTYCREGKVESEGIEGRCHDAILYTFLLLGLIREGTAPEPIPVPKGKTRRPVTDIGHGLIVIDADAIAGTAIEIGKQVIAVMNEVAA